jgi:transcriptional regulator with XRE-family HTH domain
MSFAANLKRIRIARNLTQAELSALCGFRSQSRIGNYERDNDRQPRPADLKKLTKALNCSADDLIGGTPEQHAMQDIATTLIAVADLLRDSMPGVAQQLAQRVETLAGDVADSDRLVSRILLRLRSSENEKPPSTSS